MLEQEYGDITYLSDPMEIEEQYDEEEQEDNEEQTEKDVFYGGARTSNT